MTTRLGYLGIDQYGEHYVLHSDRPRKELMEKLDRKHVTKMYVDGQDGAVKHVGYIIAGRWITLREVHEWTGKA